MALQQIAKSIKRRTSIKRERDKSKDSLVGPTATAGAAAASVVTLSATVIATAMDPASVGIAGSIVADLGSEDRERSPVSGSEHKLVSSNTIIKKDFEPTAKMETNQSTKPLAKRLEFSEIFKGRGNMGDAVAKVEKSAPKPSDLAKQSNAVNVQKQAELYVSNATRSPSRKRRSETKYKETPTCILVAKHT